MEQVEEMTDLTYLLIGSMSLQADESVGPVGKVVDVDPAVGWGVKIGVRNAETLLIKSDLTFPLRLIPAVSKVPSILDEKSP